jgi:hypothetical protein
VVLEIRSQLDLARLISQIKSGQIVQGSVNLLHYAGEEDAEQLLISAIEEVGLQFHKLAIGSLLFAHAISQSKYPSPVKSRSPRSEQSIGEFVCNAKISPTIEDVREKLGQDAPESMFLAFRAYQRWLDGFVVGAPIVDSNSDLANDLVGLYREN